MKNETKKEIKFLAFAFLCYVIAFSLGIRTCQKIDWSIWTFISIWTSTFSFMGLASGIVLLWRNMTRLCHKRSKGWRKAADYAIFCMCAAAIPYCVLWIAAECVWLWHFGFTRDPLVLSIGVIVFAFIATVHMINPSIGLKKDPEPRPKRKPNIAIESIKWVLVIALAFCGLIPFLAMQGRRNWRIVTRPESFMSIRKVASPKMTINEVPPPAMQTAGAIIFPKAPKSPYPDCENAIFQELNTLSGPRKITFSIECNCYSNNAFRIWMGRNTNGDNELSLEETDFGFGWVAGKWTIQNRITGEDARYSAKSDKLRQRIELRLDINKDGVCTGLSLLANGIPLASGDQLAKFKPENVSNWNLIRLIRNGIPEPEEVTMMTVVTQ